MNISDLAMGRHEKAEHNFYITTNLVMNLATRAKEISL